MLNIRFLALITCYNLAILSHNSPTFYLSFIIFDGTLIDSIISNFNLSPQRSSPNIIDKWSFFCFLIHSRYSKYSELFFVNFAWSLRELTIEHECRQLFNALSDQTGKFEYISGLIPPDRWAIIIKGEYPFLIHWCHECIFFESDE